MKYNNIYEEISSRMKSLANPCYINLFSGDDQKKDKMIYSKSYDLHKVTLDEIKAQSEIQNTGSFGVFMNFNLLVKERRTNDNIQEILYIFIDLDNAKEDHNELIKQNLEEKNIRYSYNAKSGNGYHFLIPVSLTPDKKPLVKGFLQYLKDNVCDRVDVATHTNERLLRCPNSIHNKNKTPFELQTLEYITLSDEQIELNSCEIKKYQETNKKGEKEKNYLINISREDIFFSTILNDMSNWNIYIDYLKNSEDRNNIFIKNLGLFITHNNQYLGHAQDFIKKFEPARIGALQGWIKKGSLNDMSINYYELLKWANTFNLDKFKSLLSSQLSNIFLDEYEFYYLEDEKSECNILLYYPEKNYYVQKSMQEVLINIYYDCKELGIDLVEELSLRDMYDKWDEFNFKKQLNSILDQLRRIIEKENRIRLVFNINYKPTEDKIIYEENTSKKYFNIYNKTSLWDYYKKQDKYQFPYIKELMLNLCNENEEYYNWFCKWLAWQIKYPTQKLPTAVILQGKQGSGKGTFKSLVLDNIFGSNCQEINQTHLEGSFNDYLLGKQLIVANEVMHNENRQTLPNILKNLVTDETITINIKFKKSIVSHNYTHWIFCTNSDNPIKIDEDDRRYSVFFSKKIRKGLGFDIRKNLDYELKEFISYLKDLEVDFDEVSEPIHTAAKDEIIDLNKDSVAMFKEHLEQFNNLYECYISLYGEYNAGQYHSINDEETGQSYILTDLFYQIYQKYCEVYKERGVFKKQNFSKKLSMYNINSTPKWLNGGTKKVYSLDVINDSIIASKTLEALK